MNINDYIPILQERFMERFKNQFERKYPERTFSIINGELVVDGDEDVVYNAMVESMEPQWVEPHERRNKEGGVSIVKGYWKQPKPLDALNVAELEVKDEEGKASGFNIEAELEEFTDGLLSGTTSLGFLNLKG